MLALALAYAAAAFGEDEAAAATEEQIDAQAQQYMQLMQPLMRRELEFVRLTCDLQSEQRPKIKAAAENSAKQVAQDIVKGQRASQGHPPTEAARTIRKDIASALKETLNAEQLAAYTVETARRTASRKKATIAGVVVQLDEAMYLTNEQRGKIASSLDENWQDDWEKWLMWQYSGRYFPQIPDQHITPHLSEKQIKVWRAVRKIEVVRWGGGHIEWQAADDEWWQGDAGKAEVNGPSVPANQTAAEEE